MSVFELRLFLTFTAFYEKVKLISCRIEFSLFVRPFTTVIVSSAAPWENESPTPGFEITALSLWLFVDVFTT